MGRLLSKIPRRPLSKNAVLLGLSLVLAVIVWLLTNLSKDYSGLVSIPVVAESNIEGHSALSSNRSVVTARCRMDGFRLLRASSRKERRSVKVHIDPSDLRYAGGDQYYLTGSAINSYAGDFFPDAAVVEAFVTDTLSFVFPAENHKKVPVAPSVSIQYRSQYMSPSPLRVKPDSVTVYGEAARLDMVDRVSTARLNLRDVHQAQHGMLKLSKIKGVRCSAEEVSYEVEVSRYVEVTAQMPLEVWNAPPGHHLQVYPQAAKVVLRCAFPLGRDPFQQFRLYIDYRDFNASLSGRCVPRTLRLPAGVLDYRVEPEVFDCIEENG